MLRIGNRDRQRVAECSGRLGEADAVLVLVGLGLVGIPVEPEQFLIPCCSGSPTSLQAHSNDSGFLLQDHNADPQREPPGECSGPQEPTLPAANPCYDAHLLAFVIRTEACR